MSAMKVPAKLSRRQPKSLLGRANKFMVLAVVMLVVFEALATNAKASNGSRLTELQQQHENLRTEVASLELQVSSYASLNHIKDLATNELDMEPIGSNVLYLPFEELTQESPQP